MHARLIVTNNPSKDSVGGIAIFDGDEFKAVVVTGQFMDTKGKLGILRTVRDESLDSYLNDEKMEMPGGAVAFRKAINKFCAQMNLIYRYSAQDLEQA